MEGGCSYSESHSIVYKWEINDITSFIEAARKTKVCEEITSPTFSTGSNLKDSWYLSFRIDRDSETSESKSWMSLFLMSNNDKRVRAKYSIFILNNKNQRRWINFQVITDPANCQIAHFYEQMHCGWGHDQFIEIDEFLKRKHQYLKNDTLTVCVDLTFFNDYVGVNNPIKPLEIAKRKLSDDFQDLFVAKKRCDVVFSVRKKKFDAHKLVLATRSSVFDAMFSHEMKENKENKVTIPDIDPEIFKKVLEYIYTDKVEELDNFAEELLEASDKYQLQGLELMCEVSLSKTLTFENVVRRLVLADRHSTEKLKEAAINYIAVNWALFKTTEQFEELEESHPLLAYAVTRKVIDGFETK